MALMTAPEKPRTLSDGAQVSERNEKKAHTLGLTSATGLVIGSIVGTGVFTMPAVIAGAGTMGIIVLAVIAVGAMLLAVLFGQLTKRVPNSDGGLYAYSRHEFGDFAGYLVGWCYWIQAWAGNAAIVSSWVFYVDALFGWTHPSGMQNFGIAMVGLWVPAIINLVGIRQMAWFQNVTVVLKFLPLLFVGDRRLVLRRERPLRSLQRLGRQPLQRHRHRRRRGPLLLHRRRGCGHHGQAGQEPQGERHAGVDDRHRAERRALRAGDRGGHGAGFPPHPCQHRLTLRQRLPVDLPSRGMGRKVHRRHRSDLGDRRTERLDLDRHRDVAGHCPGRHVPEAVRLDGPQGNGVVRHPGRDRPPVAADVLALQHHVGPDGLHLPGRPHGRHGRHPLLHVGHRPADLPGLPAPARATAGPWLETWVWPAPASCFPCG